MEQHRACCRAAEGKIRLALLLSLFLATNVVQAACEVEPGYPSRKLSDSAVNRLNTFYLLECRRAGGTLINPADPTLKGRLEFPQGATFPDPKPYTAFGLRLGITSTVTVAFILDEHGTVQDEVVLVSSGNKRYDNVVLGFVGRMRWKSPATLDGKPIPFLSYIDFVTKINGRVGAPVPRGTILGP